MAVLKGILEILQIASVPPPKTFSDFSKITINKRRLSSATVSKRLNYLFSVKALEEIVTKSKAGRRVIAYRTTEKGKKTLEIAKELEKQLPLDRANRE